MSDSDNENDVGVSDERKMYPYNRNPLWADIEPIPQDDGPHPVVPIQYTSEFRQTMDYFRAILKRDERSERALQITAHVIALNAANYTAWHFRRLCLTALKCDLEKELKDCEKIADMQPKNYQLWHHRRTMIDMLNKPLRELSHTAEVLTRDAKNYHVWSHRQWVLSRFGLWSGELDYVDKLLLEDLRNNSAWNQRHFVVEHAHGFSTDRIGEEIAYAQKYIDKAPSNESAWNYLRGLTQKPHFKQLEAVEAYCHLVLKKDPMCHHALSVLVDLCSRSHDKARIMEAIQMCSQLAESVDTIRKRYWTYRRLLLEQSLQE
jgi:protein farnesyltransferase/geranylgeranyltransferase type-1 subunit alpha